jgi:hypothetical protein
MADKAAHYTAVKKKKERVRRVGKGPTISFESRPPMTETSH